MGCGTKNKIGVFEPTEVDPPAGLVELCPDVDGVCLAEIVMPRNYEVELVLECNPLARRIYASRILGGDGLG